LNDFEELLNEIGCFLQRCKSLARHIKTGRPSRCLPNPELGLILPSRPIADDMASLYFGSFESTHRIVHIPSFWAEYRRCWDNPQSITTSQRLKILLIIGIAQDHACPWKLLRAPFKRHSVLIIALRTGQPGPSSPPLAAFAQVRSGHDQGSIQKWLRQEGMLYPRPQGSEKAFAGTLNGAKILAVITL
jgi:hypothetical protein